MMRIITLADAGPRAPALGSAAAGPHPPLGPSPLSAQLQWAEAAGSPLGSAQCGVKGRGPEFLLPRMLSPPNVLGSWECMKVSYMKSNGLFDPAR